MKLKLSFLAFAAVAALALFMLGCSDDNEDNNNPPPAPTPQEIMVGTWDGRDSTITDLGLDQLRVTFEADSGYHTFASAGGTSIDYYGHYSATATALTFHETMVDTTASDTSYTYNYSLSSNENVATVTWIEDGTAYTVIFDRLP